MPLRFRLAASLWAVTATLALAQSAPPAPMAPVAIPEAIAPTAPSASAAPPAPPAAPPAPPAVTPSPLSAEIGRDGIGPVLARLSARPDPTAEERFAIAGLTFLGAVENAYRWRVRHGVSAVGGMIFGLGADLPMDVVPQPMAPDALERLGTETLAAMAATRTALASLLTDPPEAAPDFGLSIALSDLWFDLDGDGRRTPPEDAMILWAGLAGVGRSYDPQTGEPLPPAPPPVIRFDRADASWLAAYTHLVSAGSEMMLAFDPTASLTRVLGARAQIDTARAGAPPDDQFFGSFDDIVEPAAITLTMLSQQPDATRTRAAKAHAQQMIARNRRFWAQVAAEADDAGEWIPNARQHSATGLSFPPETGPQWLAVLADAEALLNGSRSVPFWRAPIGLDLAGWLETPAPLPLDGVLQGWAVLGHTSTAPPVSPDSFDAFVSLFTDGAPILRAVMLN